MYYGVGKYFYIRLINHADSFLTKSLKSIFLCNLSIYGKINYKCN